MTFKLLFKVRSMNGISHKRSMMFYVCLRSKKGSTLIDVLWLVRRPRFWQEDPCPALVTCRWLAMKHDISAKARNIVILVIHGASLTKRICFSMIWISSRGSAAFGADDGFAAFSCETSLAASSTYESFRQRDTNCTSIR